MRALVLAIAALALGCGTSPTAPSPISTAAVVGEQQVKPAEHFPGMLKVVIYFYAPDLGRNVLIGMPVEVTHPVAGGTETHTFYTGKAHNISLDVPKGTAWVDWVVRPWGSVCAASGRLWLPYDVGANWVLLSRCSVE